MRSSRRFLVIVLLTNAAIILLTVILGLSKTGNPSRYFGEGRFTTGISCAQLVAVGIFSAGIWLRRSEGRLRSTRQVWLLIASGFMFLAYDEGFQFHEWLDGTLRKWMHLKKTPITDRIDDALIGVYGLIGLATLWVCRREVLLFRRPMLPPLIAGFVAVALSVLFDTASNGEEFLMWLTGDRALTKKLDGWCSVADGAFTLLAEGLFLAAFYAGWRHAGTAPELKADGPGAPAEAVPR